MACYQTDAATAELIYKIMKEEIQAGEDRRMAGFTQVSLFNELSPKEQETVGEACRVESQNQEDLDQGTYEEDFWKAAGLRPEDIQ